MWRYRKRDRVGIEGLRHSLSPTLTGRLVTVRNSSSSLFPSPRDEDREIWVQGSLNYLKLSSSKVAGPVAPPAPTRKRKKLSASGGACVLGALWHQAAPAHQRPPAVRERPALQGRQTQLTQCSGNWLVIVSAPFGSALGPCSQLSFRTGTTRGTGGNRGYSLRFR